MVKAGYLEKVSLADWGKHLPVLFRVMRGNSAWLAMAATTTLFVYGYASTIHARHWLKHSVQALGSVQTMRSKILDARIQYERYLESPSQLPDYRSRLDDLLDAINQLQQITSDNQAQQKKLAQLRTMLAFDSRTPCANPYTIEFRRLVGAVQREEQSLLETRQAQFDREADLVFVGTMVSLAMLLFATFNVQRETSFRRHAEQRLNAELSESREKEILSRYLSACNELDEASRIITKLIDREIPGADWMIYLYNNSRDQLIKMTGNGGLEAKKGHSPNDCWALRTGQVEQSNPEGIEAPCRLCAAMHANKVTWVCKALQTSDKAFAVLHVANLNKKQLATVQKVADWIAPPLALVALRVEQRQWAVRDSTTGVYDKKYFDAMHEELFVSARRAGKPASFLFLDVDDLKPINDTLGHRRADEVLKVLGTCLKDACSSNDYTACRFGGDEFVVIMPGADEDAAMVKAQEISQSVSRETAAMGVPITVSIGVATSKENDQASDVIEAANRAMLYVKHSSKGKIKVA
jgi:diguanylate cyclase (GGDEF)-like protein